MIVTNYVGSAFHPRPPSQIDRNRTDHVCPILVYMMIFDHRHAAKFVEKGFWERMSFEGGVLADAWIVLGHNQTWSNTVQTRGRLWPVKDMGVVMNDEQTHLASQPLVVERLFPARSRRHR
jgi:hypothetical protein